MIIANFEDENYKRVTGLWQWDYGQVLRIQGLNLPNAVEIHFSLQESGGEAKKRVGFTKDGVTDVVIPESMLENEESLGNYDIYAFIYLTDDTSGQTEYKICMPVKARPKPEAFDKPEDGEIFREAIKAVNDAADRAEESERQAGEYAEQTKADAIKTGEDRTAIAEMVESVSGIGEQVQAVKEYKEQAQTAATNALLSEQKSEQAKEFAIAAQANAETAEGKAEQHALETAGDKAEVERLATQVRQDKSSVEQTKTAVDKTAQDFTLTAQQALADVNNAGQTQSECVQQVGQDAIADVNTAKTQAVETVNTTKTDTVKAVQTEGTKQAEAVQAKGQEVINSIPSDFTTQMQSKIDKQQGTENAGKALVIGDDGNVVPGEPTQQIEVDKTLTQEGQAADAKATGDKILQYAIKNTASGEGIVRITDSAEEKLLDFTMQGKTEQTTTTGKNLFDVSKSQPGYYQGAQGNLIEYDENFSVSDFIQISDAQNKLCISPLSESTASFVVIFNENKEKIYSDNNSSIASRKGVIDIPTGAKYIRFSSRGIENVQAEYSDTPTDYEPYTGGKPSPSVEYRQEITSAGKLNADTGKYEVNVQVSSGNIFDVDAVRNENGYLNSDSQTALDTNRFDIVEGRQYLLISKGSTLTDGTGYSPPYFGEDNLNYGNNHLDILGKGPGYQMFTKNERRKVILKAKKSTTITKFIVHGYNRVNDAYEVEEMGLFETSNNNTNIDYVAYKGLQKAQFQLDRPLTKWDAIEKRDGVWGVAYKSKEVVFNGSEDEVWRNQTDSSGNTQFYTDLKDCPIKHVSDFVDNFYCDKFTKSSKAGGDIAIGEVRYGSFGAAFAPVFKPKHEVGTLLLWRDLLKENPITILYETNSEEFVPLPEETQTVLNALHTNYPTTVITNSEDCEMEVTYVCDTKNYIDSKISANVASVISQYQTNVANLLSLMPLETQATMIANDTNNILENVEVTK